MPPETPPPATAPKASPLVATVGKYLPDLILGANDGFITTLAIISGVVGAALSNARDPDPRFREPSCGRPFDGRKQYPIAALRRAGGSPLEETWLAPADVAELESLIARRG